MWVGIYFSLILWECIAEIATSLFFHSKAWGELRFLKFISSRSQLDCRYFEFENDKNQGYKSHSHFIA